MKHTPECFSSYMGLWCIEPSWMKNALSWIKGGMHRNLMTDKYLEIRAQEEMVFSEGDGFEVLNGNIAVIEVVGPMMKGFSKFGGTSTIAARRAIRNAVRDERIDAIVLEIDSPGGTVAGTAELAADVRAATDEKRVHAQINDLGASAAFWVASQATLVTANATGQIGSIGTVAVVEDSSQKSEADGVEVHVVSTGEFKGAFADGAPVTENQLKELQTRIDDLNEHFLVAVESGRDMSRKDLNSIADGRVFIAEKAKSLGLIDNVQSSDDTLLQTSALFENKRTKSRTRAAAARLRIKSAH